MFTEKAVLPAVAPQHVADEGMADVGEVAPDLVGAAGQGRTRTRLKRAEA